jgi:hypothetical protein
LLILHHDRRQILWLEVTAHPTAEWISHHPPPSGNEHSR